jgi:simple sugar transport system ATP-binding protein
VLIDGIEITNIPIAERIRAGLSYIPEERMRDGTIREFTVAENAILQTHGGSPISRSGILQFNAIRQGTQRLIDSFNIKAPGQRVQLRNLSGGNIQKLILAREITRQPRVLIAAQPTRGVDINSTMYIHQCLLEQRAKGTATLLISEDLDEIMALSDRIAVIYEGQFLGILPRSQATPEALGLLMAGVRTEL